MFFFYGFMSINPCITHIVKSGDTCWKIAKANHITINDIERWNKQNPVWNGCSKLVANQLICITDGIYPISHPKMNSDGTCFSYKVKPGDTCWKIAKANHITIADINLFNSNTHGWKGCDNLQAHMEICLSEGAAPLPPIDPNAQCGIQTPLRTTTCQFNICCSKWGYCGTTEEFCLEGCQSNCGMGIPIEKLQRSSRPFYKIGYYTEWNIKRSGLTMYPDDISVEDYTHIHYAFGFISSSYDIKIDNIDLFTKFTNINNVKKILSIGGWSFNDPPTQHIFSTMVKKYRSLFIKNTIKFLKQYNLDGIDIDWEYPSADDRGGTYEDKENYLQFVKELRNVMDTKYSLSIAAPASLWYLKGFDIEEMAKHLDYIIYMTYDFYGQWDYNNKWTGPYLKSHVSIKETKNALELIIRANVPSYKVIPGIAFYGRSFKQTDPDCYTSDCTFSSIEANPGIYTNQNGYLGIGEINLIQNIRHQFYDQLTDSIIMTYDKDQWISYTDETINANRINMYRSLLFGGYVVWAIDLASKTYSNKISEIVSSNCINILYDDPVTKSLPKCQNYLTATELVETISDKLTLYKEDTSNWEDDFNLFKKYYEINFIDQVDTFNNENMNKYFYCYRDDKKVDCKNAFSYPAIGFCSFIGRVELKNKTIYFDDLYSKFGINEEDIEFQTITPTCKFLNDNGEQTSYMSVDNYPKLVRVTLNHPDETINKISDNIEDIFANVLGTMYIHMIDASDAIESLKAIEVMIDGSIDTKTEIRKSAVSIREQESEAEKKMIIGITLGVLSIIAGGISALIGGVIGAVIGGVALIGDLAYAIHEVVTTNGPQQIEAIFGLCLALTGTIFAVVGSIKSLVKSIRSLGKNTKLSKLLGNTKRPIIRNKCF
jgi:GH18 family chitinase